MKQGEAYLTLARTPNVTSKQVAEALRKGISVEELAQRWGRPQGNLGESPYLTPACAGYPSALKRLDVPPLRLFWQGLPPSHLPTSRVGIVGSRKATRYGLAMASDLGARLAARGVAVFSGLAVGIDSAAHQGALKEAESTGVIAASPVYVSRAPGREGQNDFFIALATYRTIPSASISETARANLATGYVTAAVNVDSLVDMALELVDAPDSLHMTITDPADKTFYDNDKNEEFHFDGVERTVTMNVGGQVWYMHFHAPSNFQLTLREQVAPWLFLIGGLAFTVVALILYLERTGLHLRVIRTRPPESE